MRTNTLTPRNKHALYEADPNGEVWTVNYQWQLKFHGDEYLATDGQTHFI